MMKELPEEEEWEGNRPAGQAEFRQAEESGRQVGWVEDLRSGSVKETSHEASTGF